jgi:diguanylate cyclase (GGDEF)-like protein
MTQHTASIPPGHLESNRARVRPSRALVGGVRGCASVALAIGASALLGWALHFPLLTTWLRGYVTLKANTAICLIAGSVALFTHRRSNDKIALGRLALFCAAVVLLVSGLSIAEYLFDRNLGIDQLLVRDTQFGNGTSSPGRMAPNTALGFVLLAIALRASRSESGYAHRLAQACAFGALFLVVVALFGYAYGAHVLVGLFSITRMAIPTLVGMLALGVGVLWLTADAAWLAELTKHGSGRVVGRRLLPAALLLPFFVGIATLSGYRAGLYDPAFGSALMAVCETVSFAILVWLCARSLNEGERGRTLAGQDELTGLLNRRGFLVQGDARLTAARRRGEDALLLFIDLDGLKVINDGLGHSVGDSALIETALTLRKTFRDGDVISRLGGDEFAVIASRATMPSAEAILGRLDAHLRRLNAAPGRAFELKLSTGITPCLASAEDSLADLLTLADARMYEEKQARRRSEPQSTLQERRGSALSEPPTRGPLEPV